MDLERVHEIELTSFRGNGALPFFAVVQYFDLFGETFFVAWKGDDCIGFVIVGASSSSPTIAWLLDIAVSSSHRNSGVARKLMAAVIPAIEATGVSEVYATVAPKNDASLALCKGFGFEVEREEPKYFGPDESRLLLRLQLR